MAVCGCMLQRVPKLLTQPSASKVFTQPVRHGWLRLTGRGKPPGIAKSLDERLKEFDSAQVTLNGDVNIGFPTQLKSLSRADLREWKTQRMGKEQLSRLGTLSVPDDDIREQYEADGGRVAANILAQHYGIFRDLFNGAHFVPSTNVQIAYDFDEDFILPVYRGNILEPCQTLSAPSVLYPADQNTLWTLILTNPDGHLQDNSAEVLHWFIGNIPGNEVHKGEIICDYLSPFPPKGTGFHRYVFILYKQEGRLDFSTQYRSPKSTCLKERTFDTLEFYTENQERITPAGLGFFQAEWDESVTNTFHNILDMGEPSFEFVHPPVYHPKQVKYPLKQPFNLYLDRYRDVKDLREEVLREKLKMISPFAPHPEQPAYPNIYPLPMTCPKWLKAKTELKRLRKKQWADLS